MRGTSTIAALYVKLPQDVAEQIPDTPFGPVRPLSSHCSATLRKDGQQMAGSRCPRFDAIVTAEAMPIEDAVTERLKRLSEEAEHLRRGNSIGQALSELHRQECVGWIPAAMNAIQLACPDPANAYRKKAEQIASDLHGLMIPTKVGELAQIIKNLSADLQAGLLATAGKARAETFDDFLEHARAYLKEGRPQPAGVIAGVVFEDTIRAVCRKQSILEKGHKLDDLISDLAKINVLSGAKSKRARAAAHVRTKATHAQWDEFDLNDVAATIDFTKELIDLELGG